MIAVDTNILVYAVHSDFPQHPRALAALTNLAARGEPWGIPSPCVHEFLATVTRASYFSRPATVLEAWSFVSALLADYGCFVLDESARHFDTLLRVLADSDVVGPKVHDARIAAICRDHAVRELWTADRNFGAFPWLNAINPLVEPVR